MGWLPRGCAATRLYGSMLAALLVVGCTAASSPTPVVTAAPTPSPTTPPGLIGAVTVWLPYLGDGAEPDEYAAFHEALGQIQAENPALRVSTVELPRDQIVDRFKLEAPSGVPDLVLAPNDRLGELVRAGVLAQLPVASASTDGSEIMPVAIEGVTVDRQRYAVPESIGGMVMIRDADRLPEAPTTTEALREAVLAGAKVGLVGPDAEAGWGLYGAFGGRVFDEAGACVAVEGGVAEAMAYLERIEADGALLGSSAVLQDAFASGRIDAVIDDVRHLPAYRAARPNVAVSPVPAGPAGSARPLTGIEGWSVNAAAPDPDLAVAVAHLLGGPAVQAVMAERAGHVPADRSIELVDDALGAASDALQSGEARRHGPEMAAYLAAFDQAWDQVVEAGLDETKVVAAACEALDAALR